MSDSRYCYPGSDILINKLGIHGPDLLHDAKRDMTAQHLLQLCEMPIKGDFDYEHLKAIHHFICHVS